MTTFYSDMYNEWDKVQAQGEAKEGFPKGVLKVVISSCDLKAGSKDPNSLVQHIELKVIEGDYKDATIKDYANIINANERAAQIGKSRIKSYIDATGTRPQKDFSELKGKPFKIKTDHKLDSFVGNDGTSIATVRVEIKGIYSLATEVKGENEPLISTNTTLSSPEGVAFKEALKGNVSTVPAPVGSVPPKAPTTAPQSAPRTAPVAKPTVVEELDEDAIPF